MKFPFSWLKEIIALEIPAQEVAEILTMVGIEVESLIPMGSDIIFEVSITPNLVHSANLFGIAREIASYTGQSINDSIRQPHIENREIINVTVLEKSLAPQYTARMVYDVQVQPSPEWLVKRLEACGLRPINNVVDVTNFVMLERGHPLHAFDYDQIEGGELFVRCAHAGEKIVALDEKEYFLHENILVIADRKGPLAIAGVMGGKRAAVSFKTKRVVLESAYFKPESIRRASKSLQIRTEASYHFERGTDPNIVKKALDRAAFLLQNVQGCGPVSEIIEQSAQEFPQKMISCRLSRINRVLGTNLVLGEVEAIFKRLFLEIKKVENDIFHIQVPTYRNDLKEEIDLVEEVFRFCGNNNTANKDREVYFQNSPLAHNPLYLFAKKLRFHLFSNGLQEFLTCNLIGPEEASWISPDLFPNRALIKILNPTSSAHSIMRPTLLPNLLQVVKENAHHGNHHISGFELGKIHFTYKDLIQEPFSLALIMTGDRFPLHWHKKSVESDIFDLKGILENLFLGLRIESLRFEASSLSYFHPGRQAKIMVGGDQEIGFIGELRSDFLERVGLKHKTLYAELSVEDLFSLAARSPKKMKPLPLFPGSTRDWTCSLPEKFSVGAVIDFIQKEESKILENVIVLDLYQNENLAFGQKNITFRFFYRDPKKTVSFEEVEKEHEKIINSISQKVSV